jgi:hypothetical protein
VTRKSNDDEPRPPKFPRRRWKPGQVERVEEPERGGGYDRRRAHREAGEEIDDALDTPRDDDPA